ncbi:MAG: glycoside hydrolase family 15 protein [Chloroflexi bacterium]|nr:glycoside hydrolase family 15 protein [Chloroflexota bacterium]
MPYQPISDYGIIGDLHTVALVGKNGSIDWFCVPHFDSPSVFGSILDDVKGGRFQIAPCETEFTTNQHYLPETNVLVTHFLSPEGVVEVTDFMPVSLGDESEASHMLIRRITGVRGSMHLEMACQPAFNYARDTHRTEIISGGATFASDGLELGFSTPAVLTKAGSGVTARFALEEGQSTYFAIYERENGRAALDKAEVERQFQSTVGYWRRWISGSTYTGRWREMVHRSALVLKLLTYAPTGAIVAAPTTSLPEDLGGVRNWDYRYTWIRDAAFTVYGLMRIGFTDEAARFMGWLEACCAELNPDGSLQIMYGIDGEHELVEETLGHLDGYAGSRPVRIGNGAYGQLQLDIYGELMDAVYLFNKYGTPISYDFWQHLVKLINWVTRNWRRTDEGIWEVRGGQRHFVYSKLMCWVAIDRALRLADKRSFPAPRAEWAAVRDEIYEEIMKLGWNEDVGAFTQSYGDKHLDASNLMMPLVFFLSPTDPRALKTLDAIDRTPTRGGLVSNSLVYRYNPEHVSDGLTGAEGTFNMCTFWLVEAMTRAGARDRKRLDRARLIFEQMLGYANHLGLYSEEIGPQGEALGNFPQAFTHLSLISAAYNLDKALGRGA